MRIDPNWSLKGTARTMYRFRKVCDVEHLLDGRLQGRINKGDEPRVNDTAGPAGRPVLDAEIEANVGKGKQGACKREEGNDIRE